MFCLIGGEWRVNFTFMKFKLVCYAFFGNENFKDGVDMLSLEGKSYP